MNKDTASQALNKTIKLIEGAYAPSTIRAYKGNFKKFIQFCESENEQALPAYPATVAKFIQMLAKSGLKSSSIRLAFASISTIHKLNEQADPTQSPIANLELRRMHRTLGRSSKQALGIRSTILKKMLAVIGNDLRDLRNKALLMIAYDSLCRRSELVTLRIEDLAYDQNICSAIIRLRKSKTDQESQGIWIRVNNESFAALSEWISRAKIHSGYIFRGVGSNNKVYDQIKPSQINRIYKRIARVAKLTEYEIKNISSHSIRVGAAQDLMNNGASLAVIMNRGRWSKPDTALHYTENIYGPTLY